MRLSFIDWRRPIRVSTVLISPASSPAASRAAWVSSEVVVLPFVPVTPTTVRRCEGLPSCAAAIEGERAASVRDGDRGHGESGDGGLVALLDDERGGAAAAAAGANSCPSKR